MSARIGGDTADLPAGWEVDADNWGRRLIRNGDCDRIRAVPPIDGAQAFLEDGFIYVMSAAVAIAIDAAPVRK